MSLRKSSSSRKGSKSDVLPKPNARRKCTPAPSRVGLDLTSRLTGRRDIQASANRESTLQDIADLAHSVAAFGEAVKRAAGANVNPPIGDRGRGEDVLVEVVDGKNVPFRCRSQHYDFPVLTG